MALINCPECSKEISDEAKVCPNCGKPLKPLKKKRNKIIVNKTIVVVLSIIVVLIIGGIVVVMSYMNTPEHVMKQYVKAYNEKNYGVLKKVVYDYGLAIKYNSFDEFEDTVTINTYTYSKTISKENVINELEDITWASEYHIKQNDNIKEIVVYDVNYTYKWISHPKIIDPSYGEIHEEDKDVVVGVAKINNKWKILGNRINSDQGFER